MHIDAFVDLPELVWTGPQLEAYQGLEWAVQPFNTLSHPLGWKEFFNNMQHSNINIIYFFILLL